MEGYLWECNFGSLSSSKQYWIVRAERRGLMHLRADVRDSIFREGALPAGIRCTGTNCSTTEPIASIMYTDSRCGHLPLKQAT